MLRVCLIITALCVGAYASAVAVRSLDEQKDSPNQTVLRFKIDNTGMDAIHGLELRYHVIHDSASLAPPAIYYLPGGTAEWHYNSQTHATLHVELPTASLQPGESLTDSAGYAVGLHALNWGAWNKDDDFSEPVSSVFTNADNIEVYSSGILLAGRSPITSVCPNISFVEVQRDTLGVAWANPEATDIWQVDVYGVQDFIGSIDLRSAVIDSFGVAIWRGALPLQMVNHGEFWATCAGKQIAYFAYGQAPVQSSHAVQKGLWSATDAFVGLNKTIENRGLISGDRLLLHRDSSGAFAQANSANHWTFYRPWEAPELPKIPETVFPAVGVKIMPDGDDDSLTFEWTAVEGAVWYNLIIVHDSAYGDTAITLYTQSTTVRLPTPATGNYVWWAEPVEEIFEEEPSIAATPKPMLRSSWKKFKRWAKKSVKRAIEYSNPISYYHSNDVPISEALIQYSAHPVGILTIVAGDLVVHTQKVAMESLPVRRDTRMLDLGWGTTILKRHWDDTLTDKNEATRERCWAVMAQMLNHHFGGDITQDEIVYKIKSAGQAPEKTFPHGSAVTGSPLETYNAVNFALNMNLLDQALYTTALYSFSGIPNGSGWYVGPPTPALVIAALELGLPVGVSQANQGYGGGHAMVINGYKIKLDGSIYLHFLNTDNRGSTEWRYYASVYAAGVDVLISTIKNGITNLAGLVGKVNGYTLGKDIYLAYYIPPISAQGRKADSRVWKDSDNDAIVDFDENERFYTDPTNPDSDGDGVSDKEEIKYYTLKGYNADVDNDGLRAELDVDSDGDGDCDGDENGNHDAYYEGDSETNMMNPQSRHSGALRCQAKPAALVAKTNVTLNDRAYCDDGNPTFPTYCTIVSLSAGSSANYAVELGVSAKTGSVYAGGSVRMRNNSSVDGSLITGGVLVMQSGASVSGSVTEASSIAKNYGQGIYNATLRIPSVETYSDAIKDIAGSTSVQTLRPGRYGGYRISSGAILKLLPGTYTFSSLSVLSGGILSMPASGTVTLLVKGDFLWEGSFGGLPVESVAGRLHVSVAGSNTLFLNAPFGGQLQAPNAAVVIGQLGGRTHAGQIAAKSITIHQGTHFIWVKEGEYVPTPAVVVRNW